MKKHIKNLLLNTVLGASVLVTSCQKEEIIPPPTPTSSLGSVFTNNRNDAKQSFTLNAAVYNQFTGANGVKIMIPANSFEYANGDLVSGTINVSLIEILDQSSMILMNMPTTSDGTILVSGGQLQLTATQNGSMIYLADNAAISVMVPTDNYDPQMQLFAGTTDTEGNIDWSLSVDSTGTADSVGFVPDSTGGGSGGGYFYFEWDDPSLGWINCDYFYGSPDPLSTISITLPTGYDYTNSYVFVHFSSINSVGNANWDFNSAFTFQNTPIGTQVTIVCISEIDGDYFSALVPVTVTANIVVPVTMSATTLSAFETAIDNL